MSGWNDWVCHDRPTALIDRLSSWKEEQMVVYDLAEDGEYSRSSSPRPNQYTEEMGAQLNPGRRTVA